MIAETINIFKPHIQAANPYKGGATRPEDHSIRYKLSSNENMLGASPLALKAYQKAKANLHEYNFENDRALKEALSVSFDCELEPGQFLPANGGMELLDLVIRGFVEPGDEVILSSPTFMAYKNFSILGGATVIDVPLVGPAYELDEEGIWEAITDRTRVLFLTSPNNPTGTVLNKRVVNRLLSQIPAHVIVVFDEVYYHYCQSPTAARALAYIKQGKNVIGLHSFSKACGLAGLRLAYAFTTPKLAAYLHNIRRPFMISVPGVRAAMAALEDKEHIKATVSMNEAGKLYLYEELTKLGLRFTPTQGNFILFDPPSGVTAKLLTQQMQDLGVMIRPTEVMLAPGKVRVTIGTAEANTFFVKCLTNLL